MLPTRSPLALFPLFALFALVLLGSACSKGKPDAPEPAAVQVVNVVTAVAEKRPLGIQIEAVGTTMANESVQVTAKTSNTLTAIRFQEGDRVRRGDVLAELNAAEAYADVSEAEATLAESENQVQRSRNLVTQQALSQSQLDTLEATLKANRARLAAARARLEDTVIRAGFDGHTGFRNVSVGALITPGTVITTLDDTSIIKLNFSVPEANLFVLERGLGVTAATIGLPGRTFQGKIVRLDSRVDPVSRSIQVRAELPNKEGLLRPGMFMTVTLSGKAADAVVIPETAIVPEQGKMFVFVVEDGHVRRNEVKTGRRAPGEVEIVTGLQAGQQIVIEGTQNVLDGTAVSARPALATPPSASAAS